MERLRHLAQRALPLAVALAAAGLVLLPVAWAAPAPSPLRQQAAEAVVRDLKLDSAASVVERNIDILAPFASLPAGAALRVVSARPGFAGTWQLQLDCISRRDCLPFHAVLHLPSSERISSIATVPQTKLLPAPAAGRRVTAAALVHRGDAVVAVEELSGIRLRAPAVCQEAGGLGDQIRVQLRATHRTLPATVIGEHAVRVGQ